MNLKPDVVPSDRLVMERLRRWARHFHELGVRIRALEATRRLVREDCLAVLAERGEASASWEGEGGKVLKAQRYEISRIEWDRPKLVRLLMENGLAVRALKVDESALEGFVRNGMVSLEDVKACVVRQETTYGFRVDLTEPKPRQGGEPGQP